MEVADRYQKSLERIKENVKNSHDYFDDNYNRWHFFQRFIGVSSLSANDIEILKKLGKPQIQFNILEAYVSRLVGEFSKQQPSVDISAGTGKQVNPQLLTVLEGYIRHIEYESKAKGTANQIYNDMLKGGFSVAKVFTEYKNSKTFEQEINFARVYDPTLCGFDPLARLSDKSDGRYAFELFPKTKEEFEQEYPKADLSKVTFARANESFNWSYKTNREDILLMCDYYEKKKTRKRIVQLADGQTMDAKDYQDFVDKWNARGQLAQVPPIVKERMVNVETICRYRFIESEVLEYVETDYRYFPLVFFDGNSVTYRETTNGDMTQYTRPYPYHAKGMQQLKNFAGQTLANEIENMIQHKIKIPKDGIPPEYAEAYTDFQTPNTLIYNQFKDNESQIRLDPPQEIQRVPTPPEITNAFTIADQMTQTILGSYDASLGINNNQLSGIAIVEGATQSNATAMPFIVNYLQGFNQVARIELDLVSKYKLQAAGLPTMQPDGKNEMMPINQPEGLQIEFDIDDLNVEVTAGVSFSVQKSKALQQLIALMQASPTFGQFMNTKGLPVLLDNLEIRGIDQLKDGVEAFLQEQQQQQKQQQQMAMEQAQNDPRKMAVENERLRLQQNAEQNAVDNQLKGASLAIDKEKADNDKIKLAAQINDDNAKRSMQVMRDDTERSGQAVDVAIKAADLSHRHHKEAIETLGKV